MLDHSLVVTGDEVRLQRFGSALRGYETAAVDGVLNRLAATLDAGGRPLPDDCKGGFRTQMRGYNRNEVDQFLERVRREINDYRVGRADADIGSVQVAVDRPDQHWR